MQPSATITFLLASCLLFLAFDSCTATPTGLYVEKRSQARKYCGDLLTFTLGKICGPRGYNEMRNNKRSDMEYAYADQPQDTLEETSFQLLGFPAMAPYETGLQQYGVEEFRRPRRGVVDECCWSPCTMKTLLEYCR